LNNGNVDIVDLSKKLTVLDEAKAREVIAEVGNLISGLQSQA